MQRIAVAAVIAAVCAAVAVSARFNGNNAPRDSYTAAVVEYCPASPQSPNATYTRAEAVAQMRANVNALWGWAREAKKAGADIIVFPEYGLTGWPAPYIASASWTRDSILPFLEPVPDPANASFNGVPPNPCNDQSAFPGAEITIGVSCIARDVGIHVVVDMGDVQPCPSPLYPDSTCASFGDGRAQYNTAVAFDDTGAILSKYHKHFLYGEEGFMDTDRTVMPANFTTRFGVTFGMFVCFDMVFSLAPEKESSFVFPTFWSNTAVPGLLNATEAQFDWSLLHQVTLLAANIGFNSGSSGSGIWLRGEALARWDNTTPNGIVKLLVAEVPIDNKQHKRKPH